MIDYHPPEEADREGWQYATDFPSRYHPSKGSFDYVRRRRWMRKCRLNSTGPWFQFGLTKLLDVSMQVSYLLIILFVSVLKFIPCKCLINLSSDQVYVIVCFLNDDINRGKSSFMIRIEIDNR